MKQTHNLHSIAESALKKALEIEKRLSTKVWIATVESCTGGLLAKCLTDVSGASSHFWGGWVTYSNASKELLLNVPRETIEKFGAVSEETASAMSQGALEQMKRAFDTETEVLLYSVATTGIAGPTGGQPDKPVGLCWISASAVRYKKRTPDISPKSETLKLSLNPKNSRESLREEFAEGALNLLLQVLEKS